MTSTDATPNYLQEPGFRPVRSGRAFEAVVEQIRSALNVGRYRPGDQLPPERELAAVFGVSRTVVREAIRVLELSGLLIVRHGGTPGVFVAASPPRPLSLALRTLLRDEEFTIRELFDLNIFIERAVAQEAARLATPADLDALADNVETCQRVFAQGGRPLQEVLEFHHRLGLVLGNRLLTDLDRALGDTARRVGAESYDEHFFRTNIRQHQQILSALRARSPARAARAMTVHLKTMETFFLRGSRTDGA